MSKAEVKKPVCVECGKEGTKDNPVTFGPDSFNEEINGDDTSVWECADCREDSDAEI